MISCILLNLISSLSSFSFIPSSALNYTAFSKLKMMPQLQNPDTYQSVFLGYISPSNSHKALYSFGFHDTHPSFFFSDLPNYTFYFSSACSFRISISQYSVISQSFSVCILSLHKHINSVWFQSHCSSSGYFVSPLDLAVASWLTFLHSTLPRPSTSYPAARMSV